MGGKCSRPRKSSSKYSPEDDLDEDERADASSAAALEFKKQLYLAKVRSRGQRQLLEDLRSQYEVAKGEYVSGGEPKAEPTKVAAVTKEQADADAVDKKETDCPDYPSPIHHSEVKLKPGCECGETKGVASVSFTFNPLGIKESARRRANWGVLNFSAGLAVDTEMDYDFSLEPPRAPRGGQRLPPIPR